MTPDTHVAVTVIFQVPEGRSCQGLRDSCSRLARAGQHRALYSGLATRVTQPWRVGCGDAQLMFRGGYRIQLSANLREVSQCPEKDPTRAFSLFVVKQTYYIKTLNKQTFKHNKYT